MGVAGPGVARSRPIDRRKQCFLLFLEWRDPWILPFVAKSIIFGVESSQGSLRSAFSLSAHGLVPLGTGPRRVRSLRVYRLIGGRWDISHGVGYLLGDPRPGRPRSGNACFPSRSASRGFSSPSTPEVGESTGTGLPPPAVAPLAPVPRPQRLPPHPTVPGLSPGNVHGVWGVFKGLPSRGSATVTGRLSPPGVGSARTLRHPLLSPPGVWSPRESVAAGEPGLDPFLTFSSFRVSSHCRHPCG